MPRYICTLHTRTLLLTHIFHGKETRTAPAGLASRAPAVDHRGSRVQIWTISVSTPTLICEGAPEQAASSRQALHTFGCFSRSGTWAPDHWTLFSAPICDQNVRSFLNKQALKDVTCGLEVMMCDVVLSRGFDAIAIRNHKITSRNRFCERAIIATRLGLTDYREPRLRL